MFNKYTICKNDNSYEVEITFFTYSDLFFQRITEHDFKSFDNFVDLKNFVYSTVFERSFADYFSKINDFAHLRTFIINICNKFSEFANRVDVL